MWKLLRLPRGALHVATGTVLQVNEIEAAAVAALHGGTALTITSCIRARAIEVIAG